MEYEKIYQMLTDNMDKILAEPDALAEFTKVSGNHYKHSIINQVLIYAQNPRARLVAEEKVWNSLGGTPKLESIPIYGLKRDGEQYVPVAMYSETDVSIDRANIQPYLDKWENNRISPYKFIGATNVRVYQQNTDSFPEYIDVKASLKLANFIVKQKLNPNFNGDIPDSIYQWVRGMGTDFLKGFNWVNRIVKTTLNEIEKEYNLRGQQDVIEQGTGGESGTVHGGNRSRGRIARPLVEEHIGSEGGLAGQGNGEVRRRVEHYVGQGEESGNKGSAADRPHESSSNLHTNTDGSGRSGQRTVQGNSKRLDLRSEGGEPGILQPELKENIEVKAPSEKMTWQVRYAEFKLPDGQVVLHRYSVPSNTPLEGALIYGRYRDYAEAEAGLRNFENEINGSGEQPWFDKLNRVAPKARKSSPKVQAKSAVEDAEQISGQDYGGVKTRYKNNVAAIKAMKAAEREEREATKDELAAMRKYVGWGGIPQVFDKNASKWQKEYQELQGLLTPEEYGQARHSTLNAHYTPDGIIKEIYQAINATGFSGGKILEPALGIGKFFEQIPTGWQVDLHGTELDSLSGRIAQKLHPNAKIHVTGYQDVLYPDSFFDASFGNVPFGDYHVPDPRYNKHKWSIHEYFFGKTLDKVRPGGLIAFITSKYLMDKRDNTFRKYVAQRAEFLGAVRLPAGTFMGIANTEVTTDLIFLQKREKEIVFEQEWIHLGLTPEEIPVNEYYVEHPENLLGTMQYSERMYGNKADTACINNDPGFDVIATLREKLSVLSENCLSGIYKGGPGQNEDGPLEAEIKTPLDSVIPADSNVKNYTYSFVDDVLYYRDNDSMIRQDEIKSKKLERIRGMVAIRTALLTVINLQVKQINDDELSTARENLNHVYDSFVKKHGNIRTNTNKNAFKKDVELPLLLSLEDEVADNVFAKADIFSKRTVFPAKKLSAKTAMDALAISLNQRALVDIDYMAEVYQKSADEIIAELGTRLYYNPDKARYELAEEYLSGNVRKKLQIVQSLLDEKPELKRNETALLAVQPPRISIGEIYVQIGTTWIPNKYKEQFLHEIMKVPNYRRDDVVISYDKFTTRYTVKNKSIAGSSCHVPATQVYGTKRCNGFYIFEDCLNLNSSTVMDVIRNADGTERRVINERETEAARVKQAELQNEFVAWIQNNKPIAADLETYYNSKFNVYVSRKYDGSFIEIEGQSAAVKLRPHQMNAAARILFSGNTLLAHEVGAGKTYTIVAASMLKKQTGLSNKPCVIIPQYMLDDWVRSYYTMFPGANLLVTRQQDFVKANRKSFIARIATGDYDCVIMSYQQFEKIPMSPEYRKVAIKQQLVEVQQALEAGDSGQYSVKRLEKRKAQLAAKLEELSTTSPQDDMLYFEQLGIDALYVDEADYYKNCFFTTKIQGVAGLGGTPAGKSTDYHLKVQYLNDLTHHMGLVEATGTPVTNTLSEMYVHQRYLQPQMLEEAGISQFDEWAGTFGEIKSELQLAPEGDKLIDRTRFHRFNNLAELTTMFRQVADVVLVDDLPYIKRPTIRGGKPEIVKVKPSSWVKEYVKKLADDAGAVRSGGVDRKRMNMLTITNLGRKVAIDPRLIDPAAPVEREHSKLYACCDSVVKIYHEYTEDKALQLVFLDYGIQLYDDIKADLIEQGIPETEIAIIHEAKTDEAKAQLFAKCRKGEVRVLIGSTSKMGAGMNVQDRLIAEHEIDPPWIPRDVEQRHGRIRRQKNMYDEVILRRYVTENTFDAYMFQLLEFKQTFISQIMTGKVPARSCADMDEAVLSFAEVKAAVAGNEKIRELMELDNEIRRLNGQKASYSATQQSFKEIMDKGPEKIEHLEKLAGLILLDKMNFEKSKPAEFSMKVSNVTYDTRVDAAAALARVQTNAPDGQSRVGEYANFELHLQKVPKEPTRVILKGQHQYAVEMGESALGNVQRIENKPLQLGARQENIAIDISRWRTDLETATENYGTPFPHAERLRECVELKAKLDFEMEMEMKQQEMGGPEPMATPEPEIEFGE